MEFFKKNRFLAVLMLLLVVAVAIDVVHLTGSGWIFGVSDRFLQFGPELGVGFHWTSGPALILKHTEGIDWGVSGVYVDGHIPLFGLVPIDYERVRRKAYVEQDPRACRKILFCQNIREQCEKLHSLQIRNTNCGLSE